MSFVDVEDILQMAEGFVHHVFQQVLGREIPLPLPRLSYAEAMNRFGSDKPDTRYGMEIQDISEYVKDCGFGVFTGAIEAGGSVRAIVAKQAAGTLTRKEIDKLTEMVKGIGARVWHSFAGWRKSPVAPSGNLWGRTSSMRSSRHWIASRGTWC